MNHRRALKSATDTGLVIVSIMAVGVVIWTADTVLGWNLLPDWIDASAQLLVIILCVLALFAIVISVMCSFAVVAEAAATHAGVEPPTTSRRARLVVGAILLSSLGLMYGLHRWDQHREARFVEADRERHKREFQEHQATLRASLPLVVERLSTQAAILTGLAAAGPHDESVAALLKATQRSLALAPDVSLLVRAQAPYAFCVVRALPEPRRSAGATEHLRREFLLSMPKAWERDTIEALLGGAELEIPHGRHGVFINTGRPSAWGHIREGEQVGALVMLQSTEYLRPAMTAH